MKTDETEWFESWFGEDYVALYPHRNEAEAEKVVALIADNVRGRDVRCVLDLACGPGRHSRYLGKRWWTSGVDLSDVLLRLAKKHGSPARLVRADIRALPYRESSFDLVVNLFTSFGYFDTDEEHQKVIRDLWRVIRPGGTFVIDFFNSHTVRQKLVARDESLVDGKKVEQRREITADGRFVVKHIDIKAKGKEFIERVRLFSKEELVSMIESAGFRVENVLGDYDGNSFEQESPRVILFARRN
jgi:SAM-dependent methyltransferase